MEDTMNNDMETGIMYQFNRRPCNKDLWVPLSKETTVWGLDILASTVFEP